MGLCSHKSIIKPTSIFAIGILFEDIVHPNVHSLPYEVPHENVVLENFLLIASDILLLPNNRYFPS